MSPVLLRARCAPRRGRQRFPTAVCLLAFAPALAAQHAAASTASALLVPALSTGTATMAALTPAAAFAAAWAADAGRAGVRARRAAALAAARQAAAYADPTLDVEYGRWRLGEGERETRAAIGLSQRVPLGGRRSAAQAAVGAADGLAEAQQRQAALDIALELRQRWQTVESAQQRCLIASEDAQVARALLTEAEHHLAVPGAHSGAGGGHSSPADSLPAVDRLRADLALVEAVQAEFDASAHLDAALLGLRRLLGEDATAEDGSERGLLPLPTGRALRLGDWPMPPLPSSSDLPSLIAEHPEQRLAAAMLAGQRAALRAAEAARWPELTLGLRAEREGDARGLAVLVGLDVPLWNGGRHAEAAAAAELRASEAQLTAVEQRLLRQAGDALAAAEIAQRRADAKQRDLVPTGARILALTRAAYARGEGDFAAVLTARTTLLRLRSDVIAAQGDAVEHQIALHRALGALPSPLRVPEPLPAAAPQAPGSFSPGIAPQATSERP